MRHSMVTAMYKVYTASWDIIGEADSMYDAIMLLKDSLLEHCGTCDYPRAGYYNFVRSDGKVASYRLPAGTMAFQVPRMLDDYDKRIRDLF